MTALTAPARHLKALKLYVIWQAAEQLETSEVQNPDLKASYSVLQTLRLSADRARQAYETKVKGYLEAVAAGGYSGPWAMDGKDRVYRGKRLKCY